MLFSIYDAAIFRRLSGDDEIVGFGREKKFIFIYFINIKIIFIFML
jgi:hypothetical protein